MLASRVSRLQTLHCQLFALGRDLQCKHVWRGNRCVLNPSREHNTHPGPLRSLAVQEGTDQVKKPGVAVGVVVLRKGPTTGQTEVLLINRGTPPATEGLCIPGGRLELGESLAAGAVREVKEETGIDVRFSDAPGPLGLYTEPKAGNLPSPRPITAVDGLYYGEDKNLSYHYVIIEMLAVTQDSSQEPTAADDAASAMWMDVQKINPEDCVPSVVGVVSLGVRSLQPDELS